MSNRASVKRKPKRADNLQHTAELEHYLSKRGPGDEWHAPTPERIRKAADVGEIIKATIIHGENGFPTANFYWAITPVIDELRRRGTLTEEEHNAAFQFMRHWHNGMHRGASTSKITPRCDGSVADLSPTERQWHYATLARKAFNAVDPILQPGLAWLIRSMGDAVPLKTLGAYYAPDKGAQTQSSQGAMALRLSCAALCKHYSMPHPWVQKKIASLSRELLRMMDS